MNQNENFERKNEIHSKIENQNFKFQWGLYDTKLWSYFCCDFHEKCCHDEEAHSYIFDSRIDSFAQGQMSSRNEKKRSNIKRECERMRAPPHAYVCVCVDWQHGELQ